MIYTSFLLLFIDPMMYNLVSIHCLHKHTLSMSSTCCMHIYTLFVMYLHIPYISYYLQLSFCILSPYTHVIRTSSMSSALLLMVIMGLNYLLLWQEFVIWWNLWQECWIVSFQDHVNDLRDNLCCWFSLHVASGHCSHLICICTCHLHIIWAYVYYAHIICSGPSYVLP